MTDVIYGQPPILSKDLNICFDSLLMSQENNEIKSWKVLRCRAIKRQTKWSAQKLTKFEIDVGRGSGTLMEPKYHFVRSIHAITNATFQDKEIDLCAGF